MLAPEPKIKTKPCIPTSGVDLSKWSYYRIGGIADQVCSPRDDAELADVAQQWRKMAQESGRLKVIIVGAASNTLFPDGAVHIPVLSLRDLYKDEIHFSTDSSQVRVGAGVMGSVLLRQAAQFGVAGLEVMAGIPATIGGMVAMNAGTFLGEIAQLLIAVEIFNLVTGCVRRIETDSPALFSYRENHILGPGDVVIRAELKTQESTPDAVKKILMICTNVENQHNRFYPRADRCLKIP